MLVNLAAAVIAETLFSPASSLFTIWKTFPSRQVFGENSLKIGARFSTQITVIKLSHFSISRLRHWVFQGQELENDHWHWQEHNYTLKSHDIFYKAILFVVQLRILVILGMIIEKLDLSTLVQEEYFDYY